MFADENSTEYFELGETMRLVIIGACAVYFLLAIDVALFTVDDAFITFKYAYNLLTHGQLAFNIGKISEGFTNLLWTLLLVPFSKINPVFFSKLFGIISGFATIICSYKIMDEIFQLKKKYITLGIVLLATNISFFVSSITGLETSLFAMLVMLSIYLTLKYMINGENIFKISIIFFLLVLTRPDGVIFILATIIWLLLNNKKNALKFTVYVSVLGALYAGWKILYFCDLMPNTFYAKTRAVLDIGVFKKGVSYVWEFIYKFIGRYLIIVFIPWTKTIRNNKNWQYLFICAVSYIAYVIYTGGDWMFYLRFMAPVAPLLIIIGMFSVQEILNFISKKNRKVAIFVIAVFTLLLAKKYYETFRFYYDWLRPAIMTRAEGYYKSHYSCGQLFNLIGAESAALMDVGMIGYYGKKTIIYDLAGLITKDIAKLKNSSADKKVIVKYIIKKDPDYIVLVSQSDYPKEKFKTDFGIDRAIYNNQEFNKKYRYVNTLVHYKGYGGYYLIIYKKLEDFKDRENY